MLFRAKMVGMTVCSLREETLTCRPVSKLPNLSAVYANLHLLRKTEPNLHTIPIKKSTNIPQGHVCAFLNADYNMDTAKKRCAL